jgi:hypothetical protein
MVLLGTILVIKKICLSLGLTNLRMGVFTLDSGKMVYAMEEANRFGLMGQFTKGTGSKMWQLARGD